MFDQNLFNYLVSDLQDQEILFIPNPGNAGDGLIAASTYKFFEKNKIKYKVLPKDFTAEDCEGKVVVLGGGGNFIPGYNFIRKSFFKLYGVASKLILLPHTVRGNEDLLRIFDANVHIYCRDAISYIHAIRNVSRAKVFLSHDMVFSSLSSDFLDDKKLLAEGSEFVGKKILDIGANDLPTATRVRYFFRKDKEAAGRSVPQASLDISDLFRKGVYPGNAEISAIALLSYIDSAEEICTDRLHVGISASLLNKKVFLYDNSYGKNESIYYHSMKHAFPNTTFMGK